MGHEIAHALANHGQQRMSAGLLQQAGLVLGNSAISDEDDREVFNVAWSNIKLWCYVAIQSIS